METVVIWVAMAAVLLYVGKTLYELNVSRREELLFDEDDSLTTIQERLFSTPVEAPPEVTPEESLKAAESYRFTEETPAVETKENDAQTEEESAPPLIVVKEMVPETDHIDLDCFTYFKGAKLLVVEDNPMNQKIIASVLKSSGIEIDIADNGQIAIDYLFKENRHYDLVLMDISMPVMDGITATKIIRQSKRFDSLPIVTFTAFSLGPEIETMFEAGANAYLTKPLNIARLYTVFMLFMGQVKRGISQEKEFEIHGLDIEQGLAYAEGEESVYARRLSYFMERYLSSVDQVPEWIEQKRYDRVRLEFKEMLPSLSEIGAYDMQTLVQEMQIQFIYRNEHLLDKFKLLYRAKMQALMDTIRLYLQQRQAAELAEHAKHTGERETA